VKIWDAADSIFAPIVVGLPADTQWDGYPNAVIAAKNMIPTTHVTYRVKRPGSFTRKNEVWARRTVSVLNTEARPYVARIRLMDAPENAALPADDGPLLWEVGVINLKDGLCTPAIPADYDTAILEVTLMRVTKNGQPGAPQLALLRHLFAAAVQSASPNAIVFGGQRDWSDLWWNEQLTQPVR
jgi:hypothetical protein